MRADKFFAEKYGSRTKAQAALARGLVLRGGKTLLPKDDVKEGDIFTFIEEDGFVSGGGKKLERGLSVFGYDVSGQNFIDLGASNGGFTDCLLRRGAKGVTCVDVGESQLDGRLAADKRVTVMDKTNARYLKASDFSAPFDGAVCDLSFISLRLVLPAIYEIVKEKGFAFVLFKPQFECGGKGLKKGGILPLRYHEELLTRFYEEACSARLAPQGIVNAPVVAKKNVEYVVALQKNGDPIDCKNFVFYAKNLR